MSVFYCQSCGEKTVANSSPNFCGACGEKFEAYFKKKPKKAHPRQDDADNDDDGDEIDEGILGDEDEIDIKPKSKKNLKLNPGIEIEGDEIRGELLSSAAMGIIPDLTNRRPIQSLTPEQKKLLVQSILAEGASVKGKK